MKMLYVAASAAVLAMIFADTAYARGDAVAGKMKAATICVACHGTDGNSINPLFPKLAGQHERYLEKSLKAFKSGQRNSPQCSPMVKSLTEADIRNLAAWYASQ
ncbi:MAG: cytochrome c [Gammaproteobacteria bacterium]|nr:MAG: cytochrome c [Gammaproteobacteria bacterium]